MFTFKEKQDNRYLIIKFNSRHSVGADRRGMEELCVEDFLKHLPNLDNNRARS